MNKIMAKRRPDHEDIYHGIWTFLGHRRLKKRLMQFVVLVLMNGGYGDADGVVCRQRYSLMRSV